MVLPPGGEGGEDGKIIPGQSIVFATLEVCLCVLSKRIPALNPATQTTGFHAPVRLSKMTDETCQLIGAVITIMAELPELCSNAGLWILFYSKTCVKRPPKNRQNKDLNDK